MKELSGRPNRRHHSKTSHFIPNLTVYPSLRSDMSPAKPVVGVGSGNYKLQCQDFVYRALLTENIGTLASVRPPLVYYPLIFNPPGAEPFIW
jgi:hypothetical protein